MQNIQYQYQKIEVTCNVRNPGSSRTLYSMMFSSVSIRLFKLALFKLASKWSRISLMSSMYLHFLYLIKSPGATPRGKIVPLALILDLKLCFLRSCNQSNQIKTLENSKFLEKKALFLEIIGQRIRNIEI